MTRDLISALSRSSPDDLKITFEKGEESITLYLAPNVKAAMFGDYLSCALCCSQKSGFAACMTRCLYDGKCCDGGLKNCENA